MKKWLVFPILLLLAGLPGWSQPDSPPILLRAEWGSKPQPLPDSLRQQPKVLTIHHSGILWKPADDPFMKIRNLQSWGQREKNWPDLPYHYMIAPAGLIFEGRDWHYRPESNTRYELDGVLNVELWGNFDEQPLTLPQLRSLVQLSAFLCRRHGLDPEQIRGHGDAAPGQTQCPGADVKRYLPRLRSWCAELLKGQHPEISL